MFSLVKKLIKNTPTEDMSVSNKQTDSIDHWTDSDASQDSIVAENEHVIDKLSTLKIGTAKVPAKRYGDRYRENRTSMTSTTSDSESEHEQSPLETTGNVDVVFRPGRLKPPTRLQISTDAPKDTNVLHTPTSLQTPTNSSTPIALKTPQGAKERYANVAPKIPTHIVKKASTPNTPSLRSNKPLATRSPSKPFLPRATLTSATRAKLSHETKLIHERNKEN
jgi:hypothetical protein